MKRRTFLATAAGAASASLLPIAARASMIDYVPGLIDERLDEVTPHRPRVFDILGHGMGAPMLVAHGTAAQLDRYLRPMFTGDLAPSDLHDL